MTFYHEVLCFCLPFSDSEDSDNESTLGAPAYLMEDVDLVESYVAQLTHDHQLNMKVFSEYMILCGRRSCKATIRY